MWTRAFNARSEASSSEVSSSAGRRTYSSTSFPTTRSTPWLRSEHFRAIFDVSTLRSEHVRQFFDVWRFRSKHFRALFDVRMLRSQHFRAFSTSGGSGASIFDDFRRQEAPQRGFSRFLEAASRQIPPDRKDFLHIFE